MMTTEIWAQLIDNTILFFLSRSFFSRNNKILWKPLVIKTRGHNFRRQIPIAVN